MARNKRNSEDTYDLFDRVVMDSDTLAPDLRADCAASAKQAIWMDESEPPTDWAKQAFSELL
jgi:hypothetical protein